MRVMPVMSAATADRMTTEVIGGNARAAGQTVCAPALLYGCSPNEKAPAEAGACHIRFCRRFLLALAEQVEQEREHVDEVQVERERARDGRLLRHVSRHRAIQILALQALCIPRRQAGE